METTGLDMPRKQSVWLIPMLLLLGGAFALAPQRECRAESLTPFTATATVPEGGLESELLALTNQNRLRQGLQALTPDEALTRIAREHSAGMAQQGFISHELPSGDLRTRMTGKGYRYLTARENVASARSVVNAQDALMQSPSHKDNILAADVTRVGIGIVRCPPPYEKELYITEIFASPRDDYQPAEVHNTVLGRVEDLRRNGAGALIADPLLERLASDSVLSLKVPVQREELRNVVANSAGELQRNGRTDISRVDVSVQLLRDPKNLSLVNRARIGQQPHVFGTAVRQVVDSRNEPAFLVLTLIGFTN
jgi:uncharacterized protein YkwD